MAGTSKHALPDPRPWPARLAVTCGTANTIWLALRVCLLLLASLFVGGMSPDAPVVPDNVLAHQRHQLWFDAALTTAALLATAIACGALHLRSSEARWMLGVALALTLLERWQESRIGGLVVPTWSWAPILALSAVTLVSGLAASYSTKAGDPTRVGRESPASVE